MTQHTLYKPEDFTLEDYDNGGLARLVIEGGLGICKSCGAAEVELNDHQTCEAFKRAAHNRCNACEHEWRDRPGPHTKCPECGSIYFKWLNYEELHGKGASK